MLNLRNLRYFCAAYEERSAVGAARLCHVSQPAISAAIAQLEAQAGQRLFLRQQRGLAPTPAAQTLYRQARQLLADAEAIERSLGPDGGERQALVLQLLPSLDRERCVRLLQRWRRELPGLALSLAAPEEPADAWLTAETCAPEGSEFQPLWEEHYVLAVPADHRLARQPRLALDDLQGCDFIERSHCELAAAWRQVLEHRRIQPRVVARAQSEDWALGLVAAGLGVTIAPLHATAELPPGVQLREDLPALQAHRRRIGLAWMPPAQGALAELLAGF